MPAPIARRAKNNYIRQYNKILQTGYCTVTKLSLLLYWFFIGYWILKAGLDFYPGPFLFLSSPCCIKKPADAGPCVIIYKRRL
jgi:hypothetical protein